MKLVGLSFNAVPRMPGVRPGDVITIDCDKPTGAFVGWRISIRGQQVFFITPPGWQRDQSKKRDPNGPVTVFETPRADVTFQWQADSAADVETILKCGKHDSEPLGPTPEAAVATKSLLAQVPSNEIGD